MVDALFEGLIREIDRHDLGGERSSVSRIISQLNAPWDEPEAAGEALAAAVCMAAGMLRGIILNQWKQASADELLRRAMDGWQDPAHGLLELPRFVPWQGPVVARNAGAALPILWVLWPDREQWVVQAVPHGVPFGSRERLSHEVIDQNPPPPGICFIHRQGFLAVGENAAVLHDLVRNYAVGVDDTPSHPTGSG